MLSRYDGRRVRVTAEDGAVFTGTAASFPSGYGLAELGRAEESLLIGNVTLFQSDIRSIEDLDAPQAGPEDHSELMGRLLEGPCWIVDILPERVPAGVNGQYFAVERYYLRPERLKPLRRRFAELLLRLNCYRDMTVSFDACETWERNPDPEAFCARVEALAGNDFLRAVFPDQGAMIDLDPTDVCMTAFDPEARLLDQLRRLAAAEGLFVWGPVT